MMLNITSARIIAMLLGVLLYFYLPGVTIASTEESKEYVVNCTPTVNIDDNEDIYPGAESILRSNNLRRLTGSGWFADGQPVIVKGRILDEYCFPVANAKIEIWHADSAGKYPDQEGYDEHFAGSGIAFTNNEGKFSLVTIYPGSSNDTPPSIHSKITHPDFESLYTNLFFPEHANNEDQNTTLIGEKSRNAYAYMIILKGNTDFLRY